MARKGEQHEVTEPVPLVDRAAEAKNYGLPRNGLQSIADLIDVKNS